MLWLTVVFGLYFAFTIFLLVGWFTVFQSKPPVSHSPNKISVIIPFRDEESNLEALMQSLADQSCPATEFEILCVDDHSKDRSTIIISDYKKYLPNLRLLQLPEGKQGKKSAIAFGVKESTGSIMVTTDADCVAPPRWLEKINIFFDENVNMLVGAVKVQTDGSFFSKLQAMEFASLIGSGFATLGFQVPTMANGANLCFRKTVFEALRGYEGNLHIASGDDEHLLKKFSDAFPGSIRVLTESEAVLSTRPQRSVRDFIQQRMRWASKWRFNQSWFTRLLAVFILVFQLIFVATLACVAGNVGETHTLLFLIFAKWVLESLFLYAVHLFLKIKWSWSSFVMLQLCYPFYIVYVGVISFLQQVQWKGRPV